MNIPDEWTFKSDEIADEFDCHIREQLPWYNMATSMTIQIARNYLPDNGVFIDLGCSTGNITKSAKKLLESRHATVINVDNSPQMKEKFTGVGNVVIHDIESYTVPKFDVCVLFLSMMFVKVSHREQLIMQLMKQTRKGGCIIILDKIESYSGYSGQVINRLNIANKLDAGCDANDILAKDLSLSGIQRPIEPQLLSSFKKWFQIGEFCGFVFEG